MADEIVHHCRATLSREKPPVRKAHLEITGQDVMFGTPQWQGEHYGFPAGGPHEEHPGTLDYLVASVAGCLIGTFGGALKARGITSDGDALTCVADGEVIVDPDKVLRLRKIVIDYTLKADESQREAAERAHAHHVKVCPNARSVAAAIEIETRLNLVPLSAPAAVA